MAEARVVHFSTRTLMARVHALNALRQWNHETNDYYDLLKKLLGHGGSNFYSLLRDMTEEDMRVCELLCGAHGYAVYKMLLIKRGIA